MPVDRAIERARALIGTPFRVHGRDAATGLDCVGLLALIHDRADKVPCDYALRNDRVDGWIEIIDRFARRRLAGAPEAGDILLLQAGPAQFHLGLWTGTSLIHADARLRRVVEMPGELPWPILASWRAPDGEE